VSALVENYSDGATGSKNKFDDIFSRLVYKAILKKATYGSVGFVH